MFAVTDENMEEEGDKLTVFLNSCFENATHAKAIDDKIKNEGLDYDKLFELDEQDLRDTLKYLKVLPYRISPIINAFRKIDGSGCKEHPAGSGVSGFIVVTEQHNKYLLEMQENTEVVKKNINKLEIGSDNINKNAETVSSEINTYYKSLTNILTDQQNITLQKLETVKTGKLSMIKDESVVANEALQHLEKSDEEFKRLLNDRKLDHTKKHGAIIKHIEASQQGLKKYEPYLDKNMSLPTQTKIEYDANASTKFKIFMQQIDNIIDADISFTKIEFVENNAIIAWKSDLGKTENVKFVLQFRELIEMKDDEKKTEMWGVLQRLKVKQTKVPLDVEMKEEKEEKKDDDQKEDEKEEKNEYEGGRLGRLKGLTMYQFRILVTILTNKIYSRTLTIKTPQFKRLDSVIITQVEEKQLMEWIPNSERCMFKLLYRGTRDGFGAAVFHQKCDGKGTTISIVKSTNQDHIFGGYTEQSWHKRGAYTRDDFAWLYSLRNAKNTAKKFNIIKSHGNAIYGNGGYGPTFGSNHDLYLVDNCNGNNSSYTNLGACYEGSADPYQLNGAYNFQVVDYEVFQILDLERNKTIRSRLINDIETEQLKKWIPNGENRKFRLLFDTKIDGFASSTFHTKCNGVSPTISIVHATTNHIFGGYTEIAWHSNSTYTQDNNAWLYSLRNAKGNKAKKFNIVKNHANAMYGHNGYGPTFGNNHDLSVSNGCNANNSSYTNLGACYEGVEDPYQLASTYNFTVTGYEVWEVIDPGLTTMESSILTQEEFSILNEWVKESGNTHYKLLLRGSVDGFAASTFHSKCDEKGNTLVVVRSETNYVFGGYTEASWKHSGNYKPDATAWIYLLRSANGDNPEKWTPTKNSNAIYTNNSYGVTFGAGHDFYLADGCNANNSSYSNLGNTYSADSSQTKLAGGQYFKVTEYEVWRVC